MSNRENVDQLQVEPSIKLFEGEKALVITGIVGFILAVFTKIVIFIQGPVILPEGNLNDVFSFNAAIGSFILSIAAILPLARLKKHKRKLIRWTFVAASLYSYGIETIQNFRGLNPRFSQEATLVDLMAGMVFAVVSLTIVILGLLLMVQFFRIKKPFERHLLIIGTRYAFLSVLAANAAGIWMILLQDRLIGVSGNFIVLHGIGFHAMQTLIIPAWLLEKVQVQEIIQKRLVHIGSIAWMISIIMIGFQTALGRTVFELSTLPILTSLSLLIWFGTALTAAWIFLKIKKAAVKQESRASLSQL
ncbi:hypothetical protein R4Z09_21785 [Niallia oryzisoli]|uniref:DUF2306 domain-containing protein n=1 Tax=Niallia oryzisoli TaxID=1737571 RepID=A0ABZ2CC83_9BACI